MHRLYLSLQPLCERHFESVSNELDSGHSKPAHSLDEFSVPNLLSVLLLNVPCEVLPDTVDFLFSNAKSALDALLGNVAVVVGVNLAEGLEQILVAEQRLFVRR